MARSRATTRAVETQATNFKLQAPEAYFLLSRAGLERAKNEAAETKTYIVKPESVGAVFILGLLRGPMLQGGRGPYLLAYWSYYLRSVSVLCSEKSMLKLRPPSPI